MIISSPTKEKINSPDVVAGIIRKLISTEDEFDREKEHFYVIGLTSGHKIKYIDKCTTGTLNASLVHPREIFRPAIFHASASIILAHNHPSGEASPSAEDRSITLQLSEAGRLLGIPVLDHVIVTVEEKYFSFSKEGILKI